MEPEFELKRYAAYYKGWCQTFGEHESVPGEDTGISWLFGDKQIGLISPPKLTKSLLREILRKRKTPTLIISRINVQVGAFNYQLSRQSDESALAAIANLLETGNGSHVFLTSHFMYGIGTRILTLSRKKPLPIIYKEIGTMRIKLK